MNRFRFGSLFQLKLLCALSFGIAVSFLTPNANATCHRSCYDVALVNDGECVEGKSVWKYQVSIGTTESCYSLDKFNIRVFDCNDVDAVTDDSGNSVTYSCTSGVVTVNPSGTIPSQSVVNANQHFSFKYKVVMKNCLQCATDGTWKTFGGPDNSCQFSDDTQVPEDCECREDTDCDDENPCTNDSCNDDNSCDHTPNEDSCDDGNPCTNEDSCSDGQCAGSAIEGCVQCENSDECDDELVCNGLETCGDNGTCQPGTPLVCEDDGNPCTNDLCSEDAGGCDHPNNEDACDDDDECTGPDSCHDGVCVPGPVDPECNPPPPPSTPVVTPRDTGGDDAPIGGEPGTPGGSGGSGGTGGDPFIEGGCSLHPVSGSMSLGLGGWLASLFSLAVWRLKKRS